VAVGIAEVHRPQRAARAGLPNGAELDGDAFTSQMSDDVIERNVRAEAEIDRSRRRDARVRLELAAGLMEVELRISEGEGAPALRKGDRAHPQCAFVKGDGAIDVSDRQDDVIDRGDPHPRARAHAAAAAACRSTSPRWSARTFGRSAGSKVRSSRSSSESASRPPAMRWAKISSTRC